ncbi:MAG: dTMP kinase [Patescibacteria group bacterium]|jgi:thymidylate kinase
MAETKERQTGVGRPQWLAIEGTDAVGKTQLTHELFSWLKSEHPEINSVIMDEFSSSPVGRLIKEVINDKTFFMLGDNEHIPIAETLILGSDFMLQQETISRTISPNQKGVVISDRGIYSFFVYQGIRLRNSYGDSTDWEGWITNIFSPIGLPDLTLCLSSPIDQIERRLHNRGDKISPESLAFINQAQDEFLRIGGKSNSKSFVVLENIDGEFNQTLSQAQKAVREILIPVYP